MDCAAHFTRRSFAGLHDCSHLYQIFKTATWRCCLSRETMRRWKILLLFFSIFFFLFFIFISRESRIGFPNSQFSNARNIRYRDEGTRKKKKTEMRVSPELEDFWRRVFENRVRNVKFIFRIALYPDTGRKSNHVCQMSIRSVWSSDKFYRLSNFQIRFYIILNK